MVRYWVLPRGSGCGRSLKEQHEDLCRLRDRYSLVTRYLARVTLFFKPDMRSDDDRCIKFTFQSITGRTGHVKMVAHSEILLSKCAQFRDEGQFIDVLLKVREDIFPAHRIVLAANSDYFHAMFTDGMKESNQEVIELKDESISPDALKIVMDSIYTGDLHVNEENVFEVLAAADHLQVSSVAKLCCDFMLVEFIQPDQFDLQTYCREEMF